MAVGGGGGGVTAPPPVQLRTVEVRNPIIHNWKRNLSEINIILFKYLENISISRFYGWFSFVWKKVQLLEYGRAIYPFNKGIQPWDFEYAIV